MKKSAIQKPFKPASSPTVSFNEDIVIHETVHLSKLTLDERSACWYTLSELSLIRNEAKIVTNKISKRQRISNDICTRGLEYRSSTRALLRHQVRTRSQLAVFKEQEFQRQQGFRSEERIAFVSMKQTFQCQMKALKVGASDYEAACEVWLPSLPAKLGIRFGNSPRSSPRKSLVKGLSPRLFRPLVDTKRELCL